ncbi:hypothetical protein BRC99_00405 [Halobacteriales archaeon QS_7_69_60]|nr:MAG: hypothetical protein BRC99_00405 [Halobacteriales archaeon QS_7_69_60]
MAGADDIDLTDEEQQALHELQLGVENLYRGYGSLLDFHHAIGRGMDHLRDAEEILREAGHEERANMLRDEALPTGVLEDKWTYEIVESFEREFLTEVNGFEGASRGPERGVRATAVRHFGTGRARTYGRKSNTLRCRLSDRRRNGRNP